MKSRPELETKLVAATAENIAEMMSVTFYENFLVVSLMEKLDSKNFVRIVLKKVLLWIAVSILSLSDISTKALCFQSVCRICVCSFVWTELVTTTISRERLERSL